MQITLATIADYAMLDQAGKMSVIGIFDVLGATKFPVAHPRMFVALRIECRAIEFGTKHTMQVRLQDADGTLVVPEMRGELEIPSPTVPNSQTSAVQFVVGLNGVRFNKPGQYSVEVAIDGTHRHSLPLNVVKIEALAQAG